MAALDTTIARLRNAAAPTIETTLAAQIASLLNDREYENALRRWFGAARGSELYRRGDAAVVGAAETLCERCVTRMAARHPTYDSAEHLAAKALYEAARERMRLREERIRAGAMRVAAE
jgi:hypothetical protein